MSERTIRLVGTDAVLWFGSLRGFGWYVLDPLSPLKGPFETLCSAWNALHLEYAERALA